MSLQQSCYRLTTADSELQLDSGDASAECTTDDSEVERHYSRFTEDANISVISCYHRSDKEDDDRTTINSSSPKVVMRNKRDRKSNSARPWSVPGFSHIKKRASIESNDYDHVPQHSISETALNKLVDDPNATNSSSMESA